MIDTKEVSESWLSETWAMVSEKSGMVIPGEASKIDNIGTLGVIFIHHTENWLKRKGLLIFYANKLIDQVDVRTNGVETYETRDARKLLSADPVEKIIAIRKTLEYKFNWEEK